MKIITRKITEEEIEVYINLLMSKIDNWHYFAGPCLSSNKKWYDEGAAPQIIDELKRLYANKSNFKLLQSKLIELGLIPDDIIIVIDNGISSTLPIYTSIETINYEDGGSVLAEAFFGNETHLLNNYGDILYEEFYHHLKLGKGSLLMIQINDDYDTQVKGRQPENQYEIINYSSQFLKDRKIEFKTEPKTKYSIYTNPGYFSKEIIGNDDVVNFENLPLGKYSVIKYLEEEDYSDPFAGKKTETILEKLIGEPYENSDDFTFNYKVFPSLNTYYEKYSVIISEINISKNKKEIILSVLLDSITSDKKNNNSLYLDEYSIFPYLPEEFRTDLDILLAVFLIAINNNHSDQSISKIFKQIPKTLNELIIFINRNIVVSYELNNLFPIKIPHFDFDVVGNKKKSKIKSFVSNNISRIKEVLFLFPNILSYADQDVLSDKDLVLLGLKYDNGLIKYIPENLRDDEDIIITAAENSDALKLASSRLKSDRVFIEKMVLINGNHINATANFKSDREMVKSALVLSEKPVNKLDKDILNVFSSDREIMTHYVNQNKYNINDVSDELLNDRDYFNSLIGEGFMKGLHVSHLYYSQSEKSIFKEYLKDKDLVKKMLCNYPGNIDKVDESFKTDRDILLAIISKKNGYGNYIKFGNDQVKNDKEILELSVSDSVYNIKYAGEMILKDTDFLIEIIKKYPNCFNHLPEEVQKNVEEKLIEMGIQNIIVKKTETSDKDNEGDDGLPF